MHAMLHFTIVIYLHCPIQLPFLLVNIGSTLLSCIVLAVAKKILGVQHLNGAKICFNSYLHTACR